MNHGISYYLFLSDWFDLSYYLFVLFENVSVHLMYNMHQTVKCESK